MSGQAGRFRRQGGAGGWPTCLKMRQSRSVISCTFFSLQWLSTRISAPSYLSAVGAGSRHALAGGEGSVVGQPNPAAASLQHRACEQCSARKAPAGHTAQRQRTSIIAPGLVALPILCGLHYTCTTKAQHNGPDVSSKKQCPPQQCTAHRAAPHLPPTPPPLTHHQPPTRLQALAPQDLRLRLRRRLLLLPPVDARTKAPTKQQAGLCSSGTK